jgi:hypothetical protein
VEKYKILILINILIKILLLFLTPISIFGDGLVGRLPGTSFMIFLSL